MIVHSPLIAVSVDLVSSHSPILKSPPADTVEQSKPDNSHYPISDIVTIN